MALTVSSGQAGGSSAFQRSSVPAATTAAQTDRGVAGALASQVYQATAELPQVDSLVGPGKRAAHLTVMPCRAVAFCLCVSVKGSQSDCQSSDRPATSQDTIVTSYGRQQPGGPVGRLRPVRWSGSLPAFGSRSSHRKGVPPSGLMDCGAVCVLAMTLQQCVRPVVIL